MASSSKSKKIYDVFLSFRGAELRNSFVGHLYQALHQNGIYTFRDSEELKKGDQISPVLMKAIEESSIAIIVFSEDYASSWWCLEEAAKIMECKGQKNLSVLPVFYKVDPKEVRSGRKSYQRAMAKHESKYGKGSEKVKRWKKALLDAGNLSGWPLNDGDESKLIQRIVMDISTHLSRTSLNVAQHPVGIESRVAKLKAMLSLESDDDGIVMVGLWGQGGIGKTTLAKALYNSIFREFDGSCFLANVRETSKGCKGLVTLQETLLKDILLLQQRLEVSNVDIGINLIRQRLRCKKVLLILDDVDDLQQLRALAGEGKWFGNGSRIIVTTRDSHLLTYLGVDQDHVYEVRELDESEACELLSKHAFPTHQKFKIRKNLVDTVLNHAKYLPLALEVLGSFLRGRAEDEWESTLAKFSTAPTKDINDVLKISYDGLEANEKEMFLHIACFFKGWKIEYIKKVLDSCDFKVVVGLQILFERSLIRIENGTLQLHDLIQLMGMDIVQQECDDPSRRSRLWLYDDVVDVLSCDKGDCAAKAIVLNPPDSTELHTGPNAFAKMRRLRLLILRNVHTSFQGPVRLPNDLRWFEWAGCSPSSPEFSSGPKKLVGLDLSKGNISGVVKQFKDFQQLKYIKFSKCESLVSTPDLSHTPNLEELDVQKCKNLVEVHESVGRHDKLRVLNLKGCSKLSVFPNELKSKNLETLRLEKSTKFERFPDIPHELKSLKTLYLQRTAIKELPMSIENLVSLERIYLGCCKNLVTLPSTIYKLQNLEELGLYVCTNFSKFPKYVGPADPCMEIGLSNLQSLDLSYCNLSEVEFLGNLSCFPILEALLLMGNNITSLPASINKRDHLTELVVTDCHQLQEIPALPPLLMSVLAENCESLQKDGGLTSIRDFVRRGLTRAHISSQKTLHYNICLPGREMPDWVLPIEEDSVSFMVSKDLYDKLLGFALCVIVGSDERKETVSFVISPHVNGNIREYHLKLFNWSDSDHISLEFLTPTQLWGVVDFGQFDGSHVHFGLTLSNSDVKKWGLRIICKQLEDDLKVAVQDSRLMDLNLLYEVIPESPDSEAETSLIHEDSSIETDLQNGLQNCQMSAEEQSDIVPKSNAELFSHEACEPRSYGFLIRLAEMSMATFARCFCC